MEDEKHFKQQKVEGEKLSEYGKQYPSIGKYVLTRIEEMYSPKGTDRILMVVDIPQMDNDGVWKFDYPYSWDTSDETEGLPNMADEFGYNRNNFYEMVGDPVLVKPNDEGDLNVLVINNPEERIEELYEEGDIKLSEVDTKAIDENFDIELPFEVPDNDEIVFEGDVNEIVTSIR